MNENETYIYAHKVEPELSLDHHETALKDMTGLFRDFGGYVPAVLQDLVEKNQPISSHFLYTSPTIKWHHHERILFVGDAAHTFLLCFKMVEHKRLKMLTSWKSF